MRHEVRSRVKVMKILFNSLYGALLNEALRFSDERMGQSVTLTGRSIVRHMNAQTNFEITGEYDYIGKAICYADTDSCYFSAAYMLDDSKISREDYIVLYDKIAEQVNSTFPEFMQKTFNTSLDRGAIIKAGFFVNNPSGACNVGFKVLSIDIAVCVPLIAYSL